MENNEPLATKKDVPIWQIVLVFVFTLALLLYTVVVVDGYIHVPLVTAAAFAGTVAKLNGYSWTAMENGIINNIRDAMPALLILLTVGILIGSWIAGGIIQTMIYYGLMILSPQIFLVASCLLCCVVSLATGSSWTTVGTVGIALIGVGGALGVPLPMAAGAVISGAYFGDKMSPLSDTTNLAPAVAGATLFDHVKHMIYTVTPSLLLSLVLFGILGASFAGGGSADMSNVRELMTLLKERFFISPILFIPPLCVVLMIVLRVPAIPGLLVGTVLGVVCACVFQGADLFDMIGVTLYEGYHSDTGNEVLDALLTRGGLEAMFYSTSLVLSAMAFGGVLDASNMLSTVCKRLLVLCKSTGSLVLTVVVSCIFINVAAADQYMSLLLAGKMFRREFENRRLAPQNLSRCLEDAGTVTSPLVPWSTCGAYMSSTLGIATLAYLPFCFLCLINPVISVIYGFTGITMRKMTDEEYEEVMQRRKLDEAMLAAQ